MQILLLLIPALTITNAACIIGGSNQNACLDQIGQDICNTAEFKTNRLIDLVNAQYNRTESYISLACEKSLVCYTGNNGNQQLSRSDRRYYGVCSSPELYIKCDKAKQRYEELLISTQLIANLIPINCQDYDLAVTTSDDKGSSSSIAINMLLVVMLTITQIP